MSAAGCQLAEVHDLAGPRATVYEALRGLFLAPPTPESVAALLSEEAILSISDFCGEGAVAALNLARADSLVAIRQDFQDLFATPGERFVRPWESVWRDGRKGDGRCAGGLLMGPSTVVVQHFYQAAGVAIDPTVYRDLPDHVAAEFAFMAFLARREAEAWAGGLTDDAARDIGLQGQFFHEHVASWVPSLVAEVRARAGTEFYRGIADLTLAVIREEQALIGGAL